MTDPTTHRPPPTKPSPTHCNPLSSNERDQQQPAAASSSLETPSKPAVAEQTRGSLQRPSPDRRQPASPATRRGLQFSSGRPQKTKQTVTCIPLLQSRRPSPRDRRRPHRLIHRRPSHPPHARPRVRSCCSAPPSPTPLPDDKPRRCVSAETPLVPRRHPAAGLTAPTTPATPTTTTTITAQTCRARANPTVYRRAPYPPQPA